MTSGIAGSISESIEGDLIFMKETTSFAVSAGVAKTWDSTHSGSETETVSCDYYNRGTDF